MKLHRLSSTDNHLRSTEQDEQSVAAVIVDQRGATLLENVEAGLCTFLDGAWIFGEQIWTGGGVIRPVSELRMVAGVVPKSCAPGSCDLMTIEAWDGEDMVMRSGCAIAEGIDVRIPVAAGQAGGPRLPHLAEALAQ